MSNYDKEQDQDYQHMRQSKKIEDMPTFNPQEILTAIENINELSKQSHELLAQPFIDAIPSMQLSNTAMHRAIGNHVNEALKTAFDSQINIFDSIKQYVENIQTMQSKEKPSDFIKRSINDLRPKIATGFPLENPLFFLEIPKVKVANLQNVNRTSETNATTAKHNATGKSIKQTKKEDIDTTYGIIDDKTKHNVKDLPFDEKAAYRLTKMEGFRAKAYSDKTGKDITKWEEGATIGYGHLINDKKEFAKYKDGITKDQAVKLFKADLEKKGFEKIVKDEFKDTPLTQNQYDALVMRAYNCGKGGFEVKEGEKDTTRSAEMTAYIKSGKDTNSKEFNEIYQARRFSGHHYMRGVENRRIKELDIFQRNDYHEHDAKYYNDRRIYDKPKKK